MLFLRTKDEAEDKIKGRCEQIKRHHGKYPKWIRFDNGKELVNAKTKKWAEENGIIIETTAPYSPSQHGVAERFNRTILELVRAMLFAKNLPAFLWDEAASYATYLRNRAPTRALKDRTPFEAWTGTKPDVSHLREFGCDVWILDESKDRSKLQPKSQKMIFVGFQDGPKAIRYYDRTHRNIKVSRNFVFNENEEPKDPNKVTDLPGMQAEGEKNKVPSMQPSEQPSQAEIQPETSNIRPITPPNIQTTPVIPTAPRGLRTRTKEIDYKLLGNPQSRIPAPRFTEPDITRATASSTAKSTPKERANIAVEELFSALIEEAELSFTAAEIDLPKTPEEALAGPEAKQWKEAMDEEYATLIKMGTWKMGDLPADRKAIGCRWVFHKKRDEKGNIIKFKARLVAQGFSQKPGTDFSNDGTFAPVMRFETLRTVLAFAAVHNLKLRQFDVKGAYLHGTLTELIYMQQPPGYGDGTTQVCILIRSLYGLRQAGNVWNRELNRALAELGFTQLKTDYCCYIRRNGDDFTILLVWVDDFIAVSTTDAENDQVEQELKTHFDVKSLGQPSLLLGIKLHQEDHLISLSQSHFIDNLLKKFGLENANAVSTPIDPHVKLDDDEKSEEIIDEGEINSTLISHGYATLIGSLMYLALGTRPDIAYAVNKLAQFTSQPKPKHWTALKRIFRYLKGTRNHGLTFGGSEELLINDLNIYCDADWASDADRKSVSGFVITMAGGAIAWSSKKQSTVALSTAEAEYVAATHIAKQVLWYRSLFQELELPLPSTSTIFSDNQAAISIAHHPEFHARTKHIDIAHHFLRDLVESEIINLVYIKTDENLADIFTKGLPKIPHENLTYELGILADQGGVLR
jgi:hypothetical protein